MTATSEKENRPMGLQIRYEMECDCGGTYRAATFDLSQDPGAVVTVDLDMLGDMAMVCDECGDRLWVPAISDFVEALS